MADEGSLVLAVDGLSTSFGASGSIVRAVEDVSFRLNAGEILAIVGESGSGKSVSMLSIMGLIRGKSVRIGGQADLGLRGGSRVDLLELSEQQLNGIRGRELAMIFQDANSSLNPLLTIGDQISETIMLHRGLDARSANLEAVELLRKVGIAAPADRANEYPHQLSGGMRQRAMIAIALAGEPRVLIGDEPTTALDVTIQAQILQLLSDLRRDEGLAILFVTHDLGVVSDFADRVLVMYAGQVVEQGAVGDVLTAPRHPYTASLLACIPDPDGEGAHKYRRALPGVVPVVRENYSGCRFRARCPNAKPTCEADIAIVETSPGWFSRCLFWETAT